MSGGFKMNNIDVLVQLDFLPKEVKLFKLKKLMKEMERSNNSQYKIKELTSHFETIEHECENYLPLLGGIFQICQHLAMLKCDDTAEKSHNIKIAFNQALQLLSATLIKREASFKNRGMALNQLTKELKKQYQEFDFSESLPALIHYDDGFVKASAQMDSFFKGLKQNQELNECLAWETLEFKEYENDWFKRLVALCYTPRQELINYSLPISKITLLDLEYAFLHSFKYHLFTFYDFNEKVLFEWSRIVVSSVTTADLSPQAATVKDWMMLFCLHVLGVNTDLILSLSLFKGVEPSNVEPFNDDEIVPVRRSKNKSIKSVSGDDDANEKSTTSLSSLAEQMLKRLVNSDYKTELPLLLIITNNENSRIQGIWKASTMCGAIMLTRKQLEEQIRHNLLIGELIKLNAFYYVVAEWHEEDDINVSLVTKVQQSYKSNIMQIYRPQDIAVKYCEGRFSYLLFDNERSNDSWSGELNVVSLDELVKRIKLEDFPLEEVSSGL